MTDVLDVERKQHYLADLERVRALTGPTWLQAIRDDAASTFGSLAFPHRKMEEWRFTNVAPIVDAPMKSLVEQPGTRPSADAISPFLFPDADWDELVFVDGFYADGLSRRATTPDGVYVGSLADAIAGDDPAVKEQLNRHLTVGNNIFAALNSAFLQDGAFVHIPRNVELARPVHLVFVTTQRPEHTAAYARNLVVVDTSSKACVVERYVSLAGDTPYLTNGATEVVLADNAQLDYYKVVEESAGGNHLATTRVSQGRYSLFNAFGFSMSGAIVRNELDVRFDGEGAACELDGLYLLDGNRLTDNAIFIDHAVSQCRSRISYKGVLDGNAKGVFTGKVMVRHGAQKTDSNQLNKNLLLSDSATVDTKPQLEIFADDVKCTHGATIGQPPEEMVFYFRSRGIDEEQARGILTYGFADDVVAEVGLAPLRAHLERSVFTQYSPR